VCAGNREQSEAEGRWEEAGFGLNVEKWYGMRWKKMKEVWL